MAEEWPTVVITGVSTGIGRVALQKLLEEGCHVFGSVRKQEDADRITAETEGLPGRYTPLLLDVTDAAAVQAAAKVVDEALCGKTLTALINNAGISVGPDPMELIPIEKLRFQLDVNLIAPVVITQAFLPLLGSKQDRVGKPGRVVFIGSIYGSYGLPWQSAYCASKHALEGLTDSLRQELRVFGINVILIKPGPVASKIWDKGVQNFTALQDGLGDWGKYATSLYASALAATRKFLVSELASDDFCLPCEPIADLIFEAVTSTHPRPVVVKCSRVLQNWILPRWTPVLMRDRVVAKKCGIKRLPLNAPTGDDCKTE